MGTATLPGMKAVWLAVSGTAALRDASLSRVEVIADTYLSMNAPVQRALPLYWSSATLFRHHCSHVWGPTWWNLIGGWPAKARVSQLSLQRASSVRGGREAVLACSSKPGDTRYWFCRAHCCSDDLIIQLLDAHGVHLDPGHFYNFPGKRDAVVSLNHATRRFFNRRGEGHRDIVAHPLNNELRDATARLPVRKMQRALTRDPQRPSQPTSTFGSRMVQVRR